jgi:beta-galactosidase
LKLGVCYYPEQWPESWWADDARRMREAGISHVRLAEFSWAMIEPTPDAIEWAWLDRAVETLAHDGLSIILCTPTATPPKWLIDANPDVLAVDAKESREILARAGIIVFHPKNIDFSRSALLV